MRKGLGRKGLVIGIIVLFIGAGVVSGVDRRTNDVTKDSTQNLDEADDTFNDIEYDNHVVKQPDKLEKKVIANDSPQHLNVGDWWDSDWHYRKQITIDHTMVDDNLTNFPVLISNTSLDYADHTQSDGDDFVFISYDNSVQYNHEIEYYNNISGELISWVNVTSLSSIDDTTIWFYYGNEDCDNQENIEGVWDSNYVMVHHLIGENAYDLDDSTVYNNDISGFDGSPSYDVYGKIAKAVDFEQDDYEYIDASDSDSLDVDSGITLEAWIKIESIISNNFGILGKWWDCVGTGDMSLL